jgi:hypothetical protein
MSTTEQLDYDPWKLSSGLRDDMVLSIHAAYFAPDAEYQGGKVLLLHLIGTDELSEPVTVKMSAGADWQTADGGNTITHPTKRQQVINGSTIYGHWISHCQEIPELINVLRTRGNPTNAKIWEGLIIHTEERELKFGKNIEPQRRLMPTEYFGLVSDSPSATIPSVPQPSTPPPPAPAVPSPVVDPAALLAQARAAKAAPSNGSPLYNEMLQLARTLDWPTFLATALADDRVLADDELAQQCVDESLLYASARASTQ